MENSSCPTFNNTRFIVLYTTAVTCDLHCSTATAVRKFSIKSHDTHIHYVNKTVHHRAHNIPMTHLHTTHIHYRLTRAQERSNSHTAMFICYDHQQIFVYKYSLACKFTCDHYWELPTLQVAITASCHYRASTFSLFTLNDAKIPIISKYQSGN